MLVKNAAKIFFRRFRILRDTVFADLYYLMNSAVELEVHIGYHLAIHLHGPLRDQASRIASGLGELKHIGQQLADPDGFGRREPSLDLFGHRPFLMSGFKIVSS